MLKRNVTVIVVQAVEYAKANAPAAPATPAPKQ